jgi:transaldolase
MTIPSALTVEEGLKKDLCCLKELGIDLDDITEKLQADGIAAFATSFDQLLALGRRKTQKICCTRRVLRVNVGVKRS